MSERKESNSANIALKDVTASAGVSIMSVFRVITHKVGIAKKNKRKSSTGLYR